MPNELHTMPLKIEKLLSSRKVQSLELDEFGAYIKLLCYSWLEGGALPKQCLSNAKAMSKLLGISDDNATRIIANVLDVFFIKSGDFYTNSTLTEVYLEVQSRHEKRVKAGRIGGLKQCSSNAQAMLKQKPSNQSQSQSQSQILKEILKKNIIPPEIEWVREYAKENFPQLDAEEFMSHYGARGWKLKTTKMVDWQASVTTWKKNYEKEHGKNYKPMVFSKIPQQSSDKILSDLGFDKATGELK